MALTETVRIVVDAVTGEASKQLKGVTTDLRNLGKEIGKQPTATGKAKAALGGFVDTLGKMNPATLITGVAAVEGSVVALGKHFVDASQDVALSAGEMADATGLSVDQASRWNEVAGDIGVSTETVTGAFGKFAKAIGTSPQAFQDLGVEIAHTKDGTVDLNGTILNAIDLLNSTKDPAERAALAAKLFGKGWQGAAELLTSSSSEVAAALAQVSGAKVIDEAELKRARDFRATMDQLHDSVEDVTIVIGQQLVDAIGPTLQSLGTLATTVDNIGQKLGGVKIGGVLGEFISHNPVLGAVRAFNSLGDSGASAWDRIGGAIGATVPFMDKIPIFAGHHDKAAEATKRAADAQSKLAASVKEETSVEDAANATREQAVALLDQMNAASRTLADVTEDVQKGQIDVTAALADANKAGGKQVDLNFRALDSSKSLADNLAKQAEMQAEANGETLDASKKQSIWNQSMLASASTAKGPLRDSIVQYIAQVNAIPPEKATQIVAALNRGDVAEANRLLNDAARDRQATINVDANMAAFYQAWNAAILQAKQQAGQIQGIVGMFATGGHAMAGGTIPPGGQWTTVGEAGREVVLLPGGSKVVPHARSEQMLGGAGNGGGVTNITVNVTVSGSAQPAEVGRAVVGQIRAFERANGRKVLVG